LCPDETCRNRSSTSRGYTLSSGGITQHNVRGEDGIITEDVVALNVLDRRTRTDIHNTTVRDMCDISCILKFIWTTALRCNTCSCNAHVVSNKSEKFSVTVPTRMQYVNSKTNHWGKYIYASLCRSYTGNGFHWD